MEVEVERFKATCTFQGRNFEAYAITEEAAQAELQNQVQAMADLQVTEPKFQIEVL